MKYLMLLSLFLTACGPNLQVGEFRPYVDSFIEDSFNNGNPQPLTSVVIEFDESLPENKYGRCNSSSMIFKTPVIKINKKQWADMSEARRKALIYHEMGHCVLGRQHLDDADADGRPKSLMSTVLLDDETFEKHEKEYIHELFL